MPWLAPIPSRKRPGKRSSSAATAGPTSSGTPAQMLTIPLATGTWSVAASSFSKWGERPGSKRPEDHKAP